MDSQTRRCLMAIREYLDDVEGRSHLPIEQDTVEALRNVAESLNGAGVVQELSPGQKQAAEAAEGVYEQVTLTEDATTDSPGRIAAKEAFGG